MKKSLPSTSSTKTLGFTLIELLIVISIISILATIGITVYGGVQRNARDAKRREDINAIANALEVAKGSDTNYPALAGSQFASGNIPQTDPQGYSYCANSTANQQPGNPTASWLTGATPGTCPTVGGSVYGAVGTTNPPSGTSWKVCTYLESGSAYCRSNVQ